MKNPHKPGKVRVVFDAAAKHENVSLNDMLMTGPDLLNSLIGVLLRFRLKNIALVADIKEMFHQVKVPSQDSDSLRFMWSENQSYIGPPEIYKMTVHIFGFCCFVAAKNWPYLFFPLIYFTSGRSS